ncbi:MAG: helix-turn-helix domain-containing protein [Planctomycetaceae bacterium]|jgi:excisionase family DNA binding protein|nr:helix-turn-helix domain-containing protein [Planctomycetaceae bacterium]
MSSEYYTLEKAAEVLGLPTAEVNRLREKSELRAFRDGSTWKFRKVEVDDMLAEKIKNRNKQQNISSDDSAVNVVGIEGEGGLSEDDFELLTDGEITELPASAEVKYTDTFDSAMEEGFEFDDELIDAPMANVNAASKPQSDLAETNKNIAQASIKPVDESTIEPDKKVDDELGFSLADNNDDELSLASADDDLVLADDESAVSLSEPVAVTTKLEDDFILGADDDGLTLLDDDGLTLEGDDAGSVSDGLSLAKQTNKSAESDAEKVTDDELTEYELADDLSKSFTKGSDPEYNDLVGLPVNLSSDEPEDNILLEIEDETIDNTPAKQAKENVIFDPLNEDDDGFLELLTDDTTINLGGDSNFELTPDNIGSEEEDSESRSQFIPLNENTTLPNMELDTLVTKLPFEQPDIGTFVPQLTSSTGVTYQQEVQYTPFMVGSFIAAAVLLVLPCVMLLDLITNIWGWNESIPINSPIMNLIGEFIGIKK